MNKLPLISASLLIVGLVVGIGLSSAVVPQSSVTQTRSETQIQTVTGDSTVTSTQTVTQSSVTTSTATVNQTQTATATATQVLLSTFTQSTTRLVTSTVTQTSTQTTTVTSTQTITKTNTAANTDGMLAVNNGTGDGSSAPFTAPTVEVKVNLNLTATGSPNSSNATWSIYQVGAPSPTCTGTRVGVQGSFVDYCYQLTIGTNYYVDVVANGATWQVDVVQVLD